MPEIAMIGAGSVIFCKTLVNDILATRNLKDGEICLMSRTKPKGLNLHPFADRGINRDSASRRLRSCRPLSDGRPIGSNS
jgi:alpha-galactosidase/6-phospho-beta-glucosidase family protein